MKYLRSLLFIFIITMYLSGLSAQVAYLDRNESGAHLGGQYGTGNMVSSYAIQGGYISKGVLDVGGTLSRQFVEGIRAFRDDIVGYSLGLYFEYLLLKQSSNKSDIASIGLSASIEAGSLNQNQGAFNSQSAGFNIYHSIKLKNGIDLLIPEMNFYMLRSDIGETNSTFPVYSFAGNLVVSKIIFIKAGYVIPLDSNSSNLFTIKIGYLFSK